LPGAQDRLVTMNVLFIEDDPMNRRVVADMLDVAGAAMTEAESAEIGLQLIEENDFDMALVDLRMPGMDGITAIERIRARADAKAKLPIIVVTADTAIDLRERCLAAGANEVLFKPVAMDALFEAMGRILAGGEDGVIL
jgi:CheY-like chemotaxis protein